MVKPMILVMLVCALPWVSACANTARLPQAETVQESGVQESVRQGEIDGTEARQTDSRQDETNQQEEEEMLKIQVGDQILTAVLEDNTSVQALKEMLAEGPVTVQMEDYANMEKVGSLGRNLPRNDAQTTTQAGDLILYQGNSFVIYYDTNSWNFTRLGRIENVTGEELLEILGPGDVTVILSMG